jgi:hypothetical protein
MQKREGAWGGGGVRRGGAGDARGERGGGGGARRRAEKAGVEAGQAQRGGGGAGREGGAQAEALQHALPHHVHPQGRLDHVPAVRGGGWVRRGVFLGAGVSLKLDSGRQVGRQTLAMLGTSIAQHA